MTVIQQTEEWTPSPYGHVTPIILNGSDAASDVVTDALPAIRQASTPVVLDAVEVTEYKTVNRWRHAPLVTGVGAVAAGVGVLTAIRIDPDTIPVAALVLLLAVALWIGALGLTPQYERRVAESTSFEPVEH